MPSNQQLSNKEQKDNFKLQLSPLNELANIITNSDSNNPRSKYFIQELLTIINYYNFGQKIYKKMLTKFTVSSS